MSREWLTVEEATARMEVRMSEAASVIAAIKERYFPPPQWAFLEQVRNGTGYWGQQDLSHALAFSLWPSRGLELWGIEVKVRRGDWLSELKEPEKAESIGRFCHRLVVAAPKGLVCAGELPPVWGLFEVEKGEAVLVTKPELRADVKPLDLPMLAAIFRRVQESYVCERDVEAQVRSRADKRVKDAQAATASACKAYEDLRAQIEAWEAKTGLHGWRWDSSLAEGIRLAVAGKHALRIAALRRAHGVLLTCAADLEHSISEMSSEEK